MKRKAKEVKQCVKCNVFKLNEEFIVNDCCYQCSVQYGSESRIGYLYYLDNQLEKPVQIAQQEKKRDPQSFRNSRFKRLYGINIEQWHKMRELQENCCAICNDIFNTNTKHIHVDHNHSTGAVRDLLCNRCNALLGWCNDSIEILQSAIDYLQRHANSSQEVR